jgi:hypothetical protein
MDVKLKKGLSEGFTTEELGEIEAFLDKGFNSFDAQVDIASIFLYAKEAGKSVAQVLAECKKEWNRNWNYQHPEIKGNPLAPGGAGKQNRASLRNIYEALGLPTPQEAEKAKIPKGRFVVKTMNSTYRFGKDEGEGIRSVFTDSSSPLKGDKCRIACLAIGQDMEFYYHPEPPDHTYRTTSVVLSIEPIE